MKRYVLGLLLAFVCYATSYTQGVTWSDQSWSEVLNQAKTHNKIIFIDFYTDWCAPCKKMDKTIFPNSEVGSFYNENYISIKLNAEDGDKGSRLANQYNVSAYPSLIFVAPDAKILSSFIGFHTKYELIEVGKKNLELFSQFETVNEFKSNLNATYSKEELAQILNITGIHDFEGKEILAMKFLDLTDQIDEEDLRLVMDQIDEMDISYLQRLAPMTSSLSYGDIYLRRNSKEWLQWKVDTEKAIYNHLDFFKRANDLKSFETVLEILKSNKDVNSRQIDNLYLNFYKQNNLEQYRTFATYLIEEHIIPTRPADVKKADEEKYRRLMNEVMSDLQQSYGDDYISQVKEEKSETPMLDSLTQIYSISKGLADQLFEISSDFFFCFL